MENVQEQIQKFFDLFSELDKLCIEKNKDMSDIDKELSDMYHKIEGMQIKHVAQSHKLITDLKIILDKRREIKFETIILRSVCDTLRNGVETAIKRNSENIKQNQKVLTEISKHKDSDDENK